MSKFLGRKYVPKHQEDYNKFHCYERDLMNYFNDLKYKEMIEDANDYFKNKKVINFDIILHECRGDPLQNTYKNYKTIETIILIIIQKMMKKRFWMQYLEIRRMIYGYVDI